MTSLTSTAPGRMTARQLLNKVPEVTLYFWLIKCLCTTIGETLSDNLTTSWAGAARCCRSTDYWSWCCSRCYRSCRDGHDATARHERRKDLYGCTP